MIILQHSKINNNVLQRKDITWNVTDKNSQSASTSKSIEIRSKLDRSLISNIKPPVLVDKAETEQIYVAKIVIPEHSTNTKTECITEVNSVEFEKLVGSFVATILASGVATYIEQECDRRGKWTAYQVSLEFVLQSFHVITDWNNNYISEYGLFMVIIN